MERRLRVRGSQGVQGAVRCAMRTLHPNIAPVPHTKHHAPVRLPTPAPLHPTPYTSAPDTRRMEPTSDTMAPHLISTALTYPIALARVVTLRKLLGWDQRKICCACWCKSCLDLPTCYVPLRAMNTTKPHSSGAECRQRDEGCT